MDYRKAEILIVDSIAENRDTCAHLLEDLDAVFYLSESMTHALAHIAENDVSALVISSDLSENEGFALINRLLAGSETRHIPIILLLPHLSDEKRKLHEALFAGVDFLYKPVAEKTLRSKVEHLIQLHRNREVLKHLHDESEKLFKAADEGVLGIDSNGVVVLANASAGRLLGSTPTQLLGLYLETILEEAHHKLVSQWHEHPIYQACREGSILHVKKSKFWRTDGAVFNASFAAVPVSNMDEMDIVFAFKELNKRNERSEKVTALSNRDHLTSLPNRARSEEVIDEVLSKAKKNREEMAVLLVNLDHFRYINEGLGHDFGDRLLIEVARRLQILVRGEDFVGRLGGDEFPIVLENLDASENAGVVARKIINEMAQPYLLDGHEVSIGASVGIAVYPSCGNSGQELLKNAAMALKRAKVIGRNVYQYFTTEMNTQVVQWMRLEQDLRKAMEAKQVFIEYEEISDASTDIRVGLAPKIYWNHPDQGLLDEKTIVATADEIGLLAGLADWVLDEALQYLYGYQQIQSDGKKLNLFLEIYHCQLVKDDFLPKFLASLHKYNLAPENIVIVLSEKVLSSRSSSSESKMGKLIQAGLKIAVKDFGSGYGSLALFNKFKFHYVEIADSLTQSEPGNEVGEVVLKSLIDLSHRLDVKVVVAANQPAETNYLRNLHCDYIQKPFR
ncbi:MAG: diguanylate cyclase [Pseudomonadales bacterium]|nr:diguanylate cyclase [Pseudomonadales bacterium]